MTEAVLVVDGLSVQYSTSAGHVAALRDTSIRLERGRTLGLLGETGSGKSSLIHALLGLLPRNGSVTRGRIFFEGTEVLGRGEPRFEELRASALTAVLQDVDAAWDDARAAGHDLIALCRGGERDLRAARREAVQLLERLGVTDASDCLEALPSELALGVRQRLVLAMALASKPQVLMLDCPTSFLDVLSQARVLHELRAFQSELNSAVLLASNDVDVLASMADELVVLHAGQVVERGPTDHVLRHSGHPYTESLLQSWTNPDRIPIPMLSLGRDADPSSAGCLFAARCARRLALPDTERCRTEAPHLEERGGSSLRCFFPKEP